jgi:Icc protein
MHASREETSPLSVRILQLSDLHLTADPSERVKGIPTHEALRDVVDHVVQSAQQFDRVVITGDLAQNGEPAAYRAAKQILGERCAASHVVPGNHDDRAALHANFSDASSGNHLSIRFSTRVRNWRLIGLDTLVAGQVAGFVTEDQVAWLAGELAAAPELLTAIFMHHHPLPVQCAWLDAIGLRDAGPFQELIARSPQVRLVCAGHVHLTSEQRLGNATVLTAPSTCLQFDRRTESRPILEHIPPGYRILELHDEGFETQVIRLPELKYPPQTE